jgi:hypothetical protein
VVRRLFGPKEVELRPELSSASSSGGFSQNGQDGALVPQENVPEVAQKDTEATFQSKLNLVVVPVVVRDGQGHAVGDLTREDFALFDKGKAQTIASFSVRDRRGGAGAIYSTT